MCGSLSSHENAKTEFKELVSARDKAEGQMKKLRAELDSKVKMEATINQSFEAKVKPYLINSNVDKYIFDGYKERSRVIIADTAILRKHYNETIPDNIENECLKWHQIIKVFEERKIPKTVKNSIREMLKQKKVQFPVVNTNTSSSTPSLPQDPMTYTGFYPWMYPWSIMPLQSLPMSGVGIHTSGQPAPAALGSLPSTYAVPRQPNTGPFCQAQKPPTVTSTLASSSVSFGPLSNTGPIMSHTDTEEDQCVTGIPSSPDPTDSDIWTEI